MPDKMMEGMFANEPEIPQLEEGLNWLRRLTSGEMTEDELVELDRWRAESVKHRRAFARANLLWDTLEAVAREGRAPLLAFAREGSNRSEAT